jgi:hypothetical protein
MIDGMCGWLLVVGEGNTIGVVVFVAREDGCCLREGKSLCSYEGRKSESDVTALGGASDVNPCPCEAAHSSRPHSKARPASS